MSSHLDPRAVVEDAQASVVGRGSIDVEDLGDVVLRHVPFSPHYWFGAAAGRGSATTPKKAPEQTSANAPTDIC